tara:strand:+ start:1470 stop:2537 length:1068 start_codon:yes stop_codon:yes gene_type:complete
VAIHAKNKKCIGLIFGGKSNEHQISIKSAISIYKALSSSLIERQYVIKCIYINRNGLWFSNKDALSVLSNESFSSNFDSFYPSKELNIFSNIDFNDVDIWFPILHGLNGEDGSMQGLFKISQKPFLGAGILGSATAMDKIASKILLSYSKIPQVKYFPIQNINLDNDITFNNICNQIIEYLKFPLFIKPANSGSSIGISKVNNKSQIFTAIQKAWEFDKRIIVEEGIKARELECGVIGNVDLETSEIGEVVYTSDWYDYNSKYSSNSKIIIPARIDLDTKKRIQALTIKSCRALNINGFARADFFLEKDTNKLYLNEINTIPGFTSKSMFPLLWSASGLEIDQLVAKMIEIALEL